MLLASDTLLCLLCQPASQPPSEHLMLFMPPLTAREPLPHLGAGDSFSTTIAQGSDTSKRVELRYPAWLLILVCMRAESRYYCRAYMPVLFVGSDA